MISTFNLPTVDKTSLLKNDDSFISELSFELNATNAPQATISSLTGSTICEANVYIVGTFDNNATISIGTSADESAIMSADDIDAQTSAQYCNDSLLYSVESPIIIKITGAPANGKALISFKFYRT